LAEKRSLARQLNQAEQRFKVGLIVNTAVYETQAQYDAIVADEITAKNTISNKLEDLREITGLAYTNIKGLGTNYPLVKPKPANISTWVDLAEKQNYQIIAARYLVLSDHENIKQQGAGRYPTLDGVGTYTYGNDSAPVLANRNANSASVALQLNFPIYQGGLIGANTQQARYQLDADADTLEQTYRTVISQARQSYLGVLAGISQIIADKQAIVSAKKSLEATEASYVVGQRTMVDVLQAQSVLYDSQRTFAQDQYTYILSGLQLKQSAGTLSVGDLAKINTWLVKNVNVAARAIDQYRAPRTHKSFPAREQQPKVKTKMKKAVKAQLVLPKEVILPTPGIAISASKVSSKPLTTTVAKASRPAAKIISAQAPAYTIQLFFSKSRAHAQRFIVSNKLGSQAVISSLTTQWGKRYAVQYGHYPNHKAAETALQKLPHSLLALKPWVRSPMHASVKASAPAQEAIT